MMMVLHKKSYGANVCVAFFLLVRKADRTQAEGFPSASGMVAPPQAA